ncbi:MAG: riboflavin kinase [Parcubacteria group bacterium]
MSGQIQLSGIVIHGDGLGKTYGYPTANIDCVPPADLTDGIYAASITLGNDRLRGLVIIGDRNRLHPDDKKVELHILNFTSDLYGKTLSAGLVQKIRPFMTFTTTIELIRQIEKDCREAEKILAQ